MKISVIGGGHGCYAAAVEMVEKGAEVVLWRRDASAISELAELGNINVKDAKGERHIAIGEGQGKLALSNSLEDAVAHAELIIIPLPSTSHESLAKDLSPLFKDGQVVFLPPGTFGCYVFHKAMRDSGNQSKVAFCETGTLPYLARKHGPNKVVISVYATRLPTGVFPKELTDQAINILQEAYPSVEPIEDGLSAALMNAGPVIHPPLIMMNAGPLEHFESWDIHNEGTQRSIRSVTTALDNERIAVRKALGYGPSHFPLKNHYAEEGEEWMYGRGAHGKLTDSGDWREKIDLLTHRYMLEDTRLGLSFIVSVGRWAGQPTPVAEGLLSMASAITGRDLYAEGRTLDNLGLAKLSRDQMQNLLFYGASA
ncbi:NAD/NADP octopine/nopaline dehydrogenase family protein [Halomonas sp. McH1-25]|uniref:NAD/NADP-dependent octopine/nopaline dehydrogenase family protein n=1 Tax=unclassified Halomonas TaxID=2609666 RepID=UPI001EF4E5E1|nr:MULTISPECIES: NAD/NADP-dependent octopine/nopaline dehydrogenase family protein [unclassified Halomonas]MCG7602191.1 NAD/NADP octopine/nopaline dehydrogenase family protein [Halomonas sp. McH1-25]MCP1344668.1 NAD/NADP octopine/nopaline dehydrogenase family protein [Halomonas sp. FL8]MCP1362474.1 NAD/NADP octopine/nopaline dehydrogenase family protein [Halomonas sp. BBD45]MCP1364574.1 NAD/NADP octopine/nopaline dehydrogenase family protein [Halomonas sp. BBD48]